MPANSSTEIRSFRIIFENNNKHYKVCKILITGNDASFYIIPYSNTGKYYAGGRNLSEKEYKDTFNFTESLNFDNVPKISIHQSGQIHIDTQQERIGPLQIGPLSELRGEHIATITPDEVKAIPQHKKTLKLDGPNRDLVFNIPNRIQNCRVAIYINGLISEFPGENMSLIVPIERNTLSYILYLGFKVIAQKNLNTNTRSGITVICGWNPKLEKDAEQDYFFVRGI
jgi:hypothetical protein